MIEQSATRFNNGDWFHTRVDTEENSCVVSGFLNGEPVEFSGGGGSSDFSTATVTIANNTGSSIPIMLLPIILEADGMEFIIGENPDSMDSGNFDFQVPLYKGNCVWVYRDFPSYGGYTFAASGNATDMSGAIFITGDCTITIS